MIQGPLLKTVPERPPQPLQRRSNCAAASKAHYLFAVLAVRYNIVWKKSRGAPCKVPRGPIWALCKAPNGEDSGVFFVGRFYTIYLSIQYRCLRCARLLGALRSVKSRARTRPRRDCQVRALCTAPREFVCFWGDAGLVAPRC